MKNYLILILYILLFLFVDNNAYSQNIKKHVSWEYSITKISDSEVDLVFNGTSEKDYTQLWDTELQLK